MAGIIRTRADRALSRLAQLCRRPGAIMSLTALALVGGSLLYSARIPSDTTAAPEGGMAATITYITASVDVARGGVERLKTECPEGSVAIAGGFSGSIGDVLGVADYPDKNHRSWVAGVSNVFPLPRTASKLTGYAVCAEEGQWIVAPKPDEDGASTSDGETVQ